MIHPRRWSISELTQLLELAQGLLGATCLGAPRFFTALVLTENRGDFLEDIQIDISDIYSYYSSVTYKNLENINKNLCLEKNPGQFSLEIWGKIRKPCSNQ
jgi:hypothetical protein